MLYVDAEIIPTPITDKTRRLRAINKKNQELMNRNTIKVYAYSNYNNILSVRPGPSREFT